MGVVPNPQKRAVIAKAVAKAKEEDDIHKLRGVGGRFPFLFLCPYRVLVLCRVLDHDLVP